MFMLVLMHVPRICVWVCTSSCVCICEVGLFLLLCHVSGLVLGFVLPVLETVIVLVPSLVPQAIVPSAQCDCDCTKTLCRLGAIKRPLL